jgi:hypothetical protein
MTEVEHDAEPDPEAQLRFYADRLAEAVDAALPVWVERSVRSVAAAQAITLTAETERAVFDAGERARIEVGGEVAALLAVDIDHQSGTPLTLLRAAVRFPTAVLASLGAAAPERDSFDVASFPADRFALTPASFADIDPSLHEPGIAWGAAKAFVHKRRRAGEQALRPSARAFAPDLMDQSRLRAALPEVTFVRSAAALLEEPRPHLTIVDLDRIGAIEDLAELASTATVVGFGAHVDGDRLRAATTVGVQAMARSRFFGSWLDDQRGR